MNATDITLPTDNDAEAAKAAVGVLRGVQTGEGTVVHLRPVGRGEDVEVTLPPEAIRVLVRVLAHMANGDAVTVLPVHAELSTQEVADFLNVSRPHVVKLLEQGNIPFRKVGTHRRVLLADVLEYRHKDDERRRAILDELTREAQEMGLGY